MLATLLILQTLFSLSFGQNFWPGPFLVARPVPAAPVPQIPGRFFLFPGSSHFAAQNDEPEIEEVEPQPRIIIIRQHPVFVPTAPVFQPRMQPMIPQPVALPMRPFQPLMNQLPLRPNPQGPTFSFRPEDFVPRPAPPPPMPFFHPGTPATPASGFHEQPVPLALPQEPQQSVPETPSQFQELPAPLEMIEEPITPDTTEEPVTTESTTTTTTTTEATTTEAAELPTIPVEIISDILFEIMKMNNPDFDPNRRIIDAQQELNSGSQLDFLENNEV